MLDITGLLTMKLSYVISNTLGVVRHEAREYPSWVKEEDTYKFVKIAGCDSDDLLTSARATLDCVN